MKLYLLAGAVVMFAFGCAGTSTLYADNYQYLRHMVTHEQSYQGIRTDDFPLFWHQQKQRRFHVRKHRLHIGKPPLRDHHFYLRGHVGQGRFARPRHHFGERRFGPTPGFSHGRDFKSKRRFGPMPGFSHGRAFKGERRFGPMPGFSHDRHFKGKPHFRGRPGGGLGRQFGHPSRFGHGFGARGGR